MSKISPTKIHQFKKKIWSHYRRHARSMRWRSRPTPYNVVVSEIMLQQTQVSRVLVKFASFKKKFPDWQTLAAASTRSVLQEWSGLGYNRRALYLKRIAELITDNGTKKGVLPDTYDELIALRGIGPNTAGSILAFAFNIPYPFIETNIRSVFIHEFFPKVRGKIPDSKLWPLIEQTLDHKRPREWYYALMDYGAYLKITHPNPSRRSSHHVRQSRFAGSNRELRARIIRALLEKSYSSTKIKALFAEAKPEQIDGNLTRLAAEGFLIVRRGIYSVI